MSVRTNLVLMGLVAVSVIGCRSRDEQMNSLQKALGNTLVQPQKIGNAMVIGDTALTGNRNVEGGLPQFTRTNFAPTSDVYLSRKQFVIYYNVKGKIPAWTAWQVVDTDLGPQTRSNRFRGDEILNNFMRAKERVEGVSSGDYGGTCFDRGHQTASADRSNSLEDNEATYLMSNMAPQTAFLNERIWSDLEKHTRQLVEEKGVPAVEAKRAHVLEHLKEQRHLFGLHSIETATNTGHDDGKCVHGDDNDGADACSNPSAISSSHN